MNKLTPQQAINAQLQRELRRKQTNLTQQVASVLESTNDASRRASQQAIRRIEKSIALRVAKLLCPHMHMHITSQPTRNATAPNNTLVYCPACKSSTLYEK